MTLAWRSHWYCSGDKAMVRSSKRLFLATVRAAGLNTWVGAFKRELLRFLLCRNVTGPYRLYFASRYNDTLKRAMQRGERIFSAAYIMPTHAAGYSDTSKHRNYLAILEKMIADGVPARLLELKTMASAFELLRSYPLMGNFLAYQFVTDLNYSNFLNFSEMEFVVPGPGALDGIQKCFTSSGKLNEADVIRFIADQQNEEFARLGLKFHSLWGRPLQLIDCQNLFCEVSKYARVAHPEIEGLTGRKRIKQKFTPSTQLIQYWFPPKWGLNDLISVRSQGPIRQHNPKNEDAQSRLCLGFRP